MKKAGWIAGLAPLAMTASGGMQDVVAKTEARPNIIYFVTHDLGRMVGTYGAQVDNPDIPSPTGRITFFNWPYWKATDDLFPSGFIGPVILGEKL